ncbi:hypothetical protein [Microbulbifer sp. SAOS-129_SWC]|uniref:hypothetical protein n=1 Tax=Microbulbifer sp. SAOS-129_SWC TaxID=3145235 RepID=UPI003217EE40
MAKFSTDSRYAKYSQPFKTTDPRGREVLAVTPAAIPAKRNRGTHVTKDPQRLDHLAWFYLKRADAFWEITAHNGRLLPDAVLAQARIRIPLDGD